MIGRCGQVMLVRLPGLAPSPSRVLKGYLIALTMIARGGPAVACRIDACTRRCLIMIGSCWAMLRRGSLYVRMVFSVFFSLELVTEDSSLQRSATRCNAAQHAATQRSTLQRRAPALRLPVLPSVAALPRQQALISIIRTVIPVIHTLMPIICTLIPIIRTLMPIIRTLIPVFCIITLWECRRFGSSPMESRTTYTG